MKRARKSIHTDLPIARFSRLERFACDAYRVEIDLTFHALRVGLVDSIVVLPMFSHVGR